MPTTATTKTDTAPSLDKLLGILEKAAEAGEVTGDQCKLISAILGTARTTHELRRMETEREQAGQYGKE